MKTTVYIRKEDEEAWESIQNKSQWISDMLNDNDTDLDRRIKQLVEKELNRREASYG